jgi:deoxyribodipyrimidine photo-lyase
MADRTDAPCIVWFRDDLRLSDHPALHAAAHTKRPVICVYVFDKSGQSTGGRRIGGAARWWLAQSLWALQRRLGAVGTPLVLRTGNVARIIPELARETGAGDVFWNQIARHQASEREIASALRDIGIGAHGFAGDLLAAPESVRTKEGRGLRVFTPFWLRIQAMGARREPLPAPRHLRAGPSLASETVESLSLEPSHPDWAGGLRETWTAGESSAQERCENFLKTSLKGYTEDRDRPDRDGTSTLSPHLRFGEIGPRQIWHTTQFAAAERPAIASDADKFLSELGWREFCRHLLFDVPDLATRNLQTSFDAFPWRDDEMALKAWQRGQTGYPIVDAGMRQLWHTGVMHNRVRMVTASFLVKHLLIDWREGEQWFWDTLVDADAGSNPANWQWVAGCGADAAPYFRVFNPVLQGQKFDPDGAYVRRWVPELARLPNKLIQRPWEATPLELASAGIALGKSYPHPIVDHRKGRERALEAYKKVRAS